MNKQPCGVFTPQDWAKSFATVEQVEQWAQARVFNKPHTQWHEDFWGDVVRCVRGEPCKFDWETCV